MRRSKKERAEEVPKINCLACGQEHDFDSKYCKYCGAPVEPETLKVPPHLKGKRSFKKLLLVLLIVIVIVSVLSIFF
jgi:predicted amidophosphoribosyltransferase